MTATASPSASAPANSIGHVVQIIGPVLDVAFESGQLPDLYNAIEIKTTTDSGQAVRVVAEVLVRQRELLPQVVIAR